MRRPSASTCALPVDASSSGRRPGSLMHQAMRARGAPSTTVISACISRDRPGCSARQPLRARHQAAPAGGRGAGVPRHQPRSAFRVLNSHFVVRSDGVLERDTITDVRGFSVAGDLVTASLVRRGDGLGGEEEGQLVWRDDTRAHGSGSWHITIPPGDTSGEYQIELESRDTGVAATFDHVRCA
jgi:hypothetical protein